MPDQIRISAKNLGAAAMPDFCPRCFWVRHTAPKGLPYQIFPGIFSTIDAYSKRVIHGWFDRHGGPPPWLAGLGELAGYIDPPHHTKFFTVDAATNIKLTGAVDGIYLRPDESRLLVDYKTARFTPKQDELLPVYDAQLNGYALIAEAIGLGPISGLSLIYTEPVTDSDVAGADNVHTAAGFIMRFAAGIHEVELDTSKIAPLLERARDILDMADAPQGAEGCKDCVKLDEMMAILAGEASA